MSSPSPQKVLQRWSESQPSPLLNTLDLKAEIAALETKIKSLEFQKSHATSLGRRNALVNAINTAIRQRNQLAKRYNQVTGRV